jgi:regulator of sigma E protease
MDFITGFGATIFWFLLVLTVLVFVHEFGHYWVARRCGVKVEEFSIGFGRELFGWNDKHGTRWKFCLLPLGGFVKMYGEADAANRPTNAEFAEHEGVLTPQQRAESFVYKNVGQRSAIVAAGPMANFIFAIVLLAGLFATYGQPFTPPVVGSVVEGSAAAEAGLRPGDRIVAIDGTTIQRFEEIQHWISLNAGKTVTLAVEREGERLDLRATPRVEFVDTRVGGKAQVGRLGIGRSGVEFLRHNPATAVWQAIRESGAMVTGTLQALGQMIGGTRSASELGGPILIAQMSGQSAEGGVTGIIWFMAILSINLGLINLFPIPVLDGGHLVFYGIEALRGRPLGEGAQRLGYRVGLAMVLTFVIFATWNDLNRLPIFDFVKGLAS